jgi:hypothetical protein
LERVDRDLTRKSVRTDPSRDRWNNREQEFDLFARLPLPAVLDKTPNE